MEWKATSFLILVPCSLQGLQLVRKGQGGSQDRLMMVKQPRRKTAANQKNRKRKVKMEERTLGEQGRTLLAAELQAVSANRESANTEWSSMTHRLLKQQLVTSAKELDFSKYSFLNPLK